MLSRTKPATISTSEVNDVVEKRPELPELVDFITNRDYIGAVTLLEAFSLILVSKINRQFRQRKFEKLFVVRILLFSFG